VSKDRKTVTVVIRDESGRIPVDEGYIPPDSNLAKPKEKKEVKDADKA